MTTETQAPGPVGVLARAIDLHEKAAMPWPEAERLALSETGVDDAEIDEVVGEAGGLEMLLTTPDDLRDFARSVLVHGSARIAAIPAPEGAQLPPLPQANHSMHALTGYTADDMHAYARAALAAPAKAPCTHGAGHCTNTSCERLGECQYMAAPAPQAAPAWQPIETAPKDRTEILGWTPACGALVLYWEKLSDDGRWSDGMSYFHREPTHWMPLPAAPQTKEPTHDR